MTDAWTTGRLGRAFDEQFTAGRDGYLFRAGRHGAAIPASVAEHDAFVAAYARAARRAWWSTGAAFAVALAGLGAFALWQGVSPATAGFRVAMGAVFLAGIFGYMTTLTRAMNAPRRVLAGRPAVAPPLDPVAFRRSARRAQPWSTFAIGPFFVGVLWLRWGPRGDVLAGWNAAWVAGTAAYLAFMAYFAWRKWQAERSPA